MLGLIVISLIGARTQMANDKSFSKIIQERPFSLVLFTKSRCSSCKKILNIMDQITDKYSQKISMVMVDIDDSEALASNYSITNVPIIGLFNHEHLLKIYKGELNEKMIIKICEDETQFSTNVIYLNSTFDVFEFQENNPPVNLIIVNSSKNHISTSQEIVQHLSGITAIGIISNQEIANVLNLPVARLYHPLENLTFDYLSLNYSEILRNINQHFKLIEQQEDFGVSHLKNSVTALIDSHDPLHWVRVQELFSIAPEYPEISFNVCDFYVCSKAVSELGISNFGFPFYSLSSIKKSRPILLRNSSPSLSDFRIWLDEKVRGIIPNQTVNGLPVLYARNFIKICLDPSKDVILLIGDPLLPDWKDSLKIFKKLMKLFQGYPSIHFYEFDPKIQKVPGLQLPSEDYTLISVWAARREPNAQTFKATLPFPLVFENIMRLIETKISPQDMQTLTENVKKVYEQMQK